MKVSGYLQQIWNTRSFVNSDHWTQGPQNPQFVLTIIAPTLLFLASSPAQRFPAYSLHCARCLKSTSRHKVSDGIIFAWVSILQHVWNLKWKQWTNKEKQEHISEKIFEVPRNHWRNHRNNCKEDILKLSWRNKLASSVDAISISEVWNYQWLND